MESLRRHRQQTPDFRISDCSSDEENTIFSRHLSKHGETAAVDITWSSDDEFSTEKCQRSVNTSLVNYGATTLLCTNISRSARKSKLPNLCIKRKLREIETNEEVRTTLGSRNIPLDNNSFNKSSWCKVRKTFSILRCQSTFGECTPTEQPKTPSKNRSSQYDSADTSIEWSSSSSENGSPKRTQKSSAPSELELLVALIQRETVTAKVKSHATTFTQKKKQYIQGGYAERLQKLEEASRIERNFLQNDQKLGLQEGTRMCVLKLNKAYGIHMATVQLEQRDKSNVNSDLSANVHIVINKDIAAHVKVGSRIKAFFDPIIEPYTLQSMDGAAKEVIYVQPHKLLLL